MRCARRSIPPEIGRYAWVLVAGLAGCKGLWLTDDPPAVQIEGGGRPCERADTGIRDCLGDPSIERGAEVFERYCTDCHGDDGSGDFGPSLYLEFPALTDEEIRSVIVNGSGSMRKLELVDLDVYAVLAYGRMQFGEYDPGSLFRAEVTYTSSNVALEIYNGIADYEFGMAETDAESPEPWTGEDCLNGYTTGSGVEYLLCHETSSTGIVLSAVDSVDEVIEGETTLMNYVSPEVTTYYLLSKAMGDCWVWGNDPMYYAGLGCTETDW